jgi:hypothetical protein
MCGRRTAFSFWLLAKAKAKEEADPCGMTTRKARARTKAKVTTGVLPLRQAQGQDDGIFTGADNSRPANNNQQLEARS